MNKPILILSLFLMLITGCQADPTATPTATPSPVLTQTLVIRPLVTLVPADSATVFSTPTTHLPSATPIPLTLPNDPPPSPYPLSTPVPPTPAAANPVATPVPDPTLTPPATPPTATPTRAHPVYGGPALDHTEVGIQVHLHQEDLSLIVEHLRNLQVGWVKVQVSWKLHEPHPDQYDQFLMEELDALVEAAAANDIYVLLSVAKAPDWSRSTNEMDGPPLDVADFQDFMGFLAQRYQGRVQAYELWNESNLRREWNGAPLSATDFVELVRAGAAGVRASDPLAILISGAPAPTGINDGIDAIEDRAYLRSMLAAGVADIVDALGAHPYGWANPPESSVLDPNQVAPTHNNHPSFFFRDTLWEYFTILNEFGRSEKQVWVTEFGWASFDNMGAHSPDGFEYMDAVDEWQQAQYTLSAYALAHSWRWVGPLFIWNLNFAPLLGTDFPESGYCLLRPDGSPRPVYLAMETMLD